MRSNARIGSALRRDGRADVAVGGEPVGGVLEGGGGGARRVAEVAGGFAR
jgi:hypothetical protein